MFLIYIYTYKIFPSVSAIDRKYKYTNKFVWKKVMNDGLITKRFTYLTFEADGISHNIFLSPLLEREHWSLWDLDNEVHPATIIISTTIH